MILHDSAPMAEHAAQELHALNGLCTLSCYDNIVRAYLVEWDTSRRAIEEQAYQTITGNDIGSRTWIFRDD